MHILRLMPFLYLPISNEQNKSIYKNSIGGVQIQSYRLIKAISDLNVGQTVITCGGSSKNCFSNDVEIINPPMYKFINKLFEPGNATIYIIWFFYCLFNVKKIILYKKIDVVHINCTGSFIPLILSIVICKIVCIPVVLTIHCSLIATFKKRGKRYNHASFWEMNCERVAIKKCNYIIVLNEITKQKIIVDFNCCISESKISVIGDAIQYKDYNNVNIDKYLKIKTELGIPYNQKNIVFVGRLSEEKGCDLFIKALNNLHYKAWHATIVGDGPQRKDLQKQVQTFGLDKQISFIGFVANEDIPYYISSSDIMVIPSIHEEFGSVLLEIAAIKKPVVASNVDGLAHNIVHGKSGFLVDVYDVDSFTNSLDILLNNEDLRRAFGADLFNSTQAKYDLPNIAMSYYSVYINILNIRNNHFCNV